MLKYSVVLPVFNEESNIPTLYQRVKGVMDSLSEHYDIIFVNDGSYDRTAEMLKDLHQHDHKVKVLNFSRNFGHQTAVSAGLQYAHGQFVTVLDGDLQDPPEILPQFFAKLEEGYDTVYAIRRKRKEGFIKRVAYDMFYRFLRSVANIDIPLDSGDFCVMNQRMVKALNSLPERNRFIRGLRSWVGFKQVGLEYERNARHSGDSKYSLRKMLKLGFDGIFSFSYAPLQFMFYFGFVSLALSVIGVILAVYFKYFTTAYKNVPGFATTIILVMFIGGLQMFCIGILGEYMRRIYEESKQRPHYILESSLGFEHKG